VAHNPVL